MMLSAKWAGFFEFGAQIQVLEMVLSSVEGSMNSEMALMSFSEAFFGLGFLSISANVETWHVSRTRR
jgi:hypothetical protein